MPEILGRVYHALLASFSDCPVIRLLKTAIADTHKQEDYEWKDSTVVVKGTFPGQLAEQKKEEAVNYLVGTTEVDG